MKYLTETLSVICIVLLLTAIALIWYLIIADPVVSLPENENTAAEFALPVPENIAENKTLQRFPLESTVLTQLAQDDLSSKLQQTACRTVLSLLPENAVISGESTLTLLNTHTAQVSGRAMLAATSEKPAKLLQYRIKVNFLPNGSCEAAFPEFTLAE